MALEIKKLNRNIHALFKAKKVQKALKSRVRNIRNGELLCK